MTNKNLIKTYLYSTVKYWLQYALVYNMRVYFWLPAKGKIKVQAYNTQCCDLETMVSRLECIRVHFVQVSVSVLRPDGPGLGLGLKTASLVPM